MNEREHDASPTFYDPGAVLWWSVAACGPAWIVLPAPWGLVPGAAYALGLWSLNRLHLGQPRRVLADLAWFALVLVAIALQPLVGGAFLLAFVVTGHRDQRRALSEGFQRRESLFAAVVAATALLGGAVLILMLFAVALGGS